MRHQDFFLRHHSCTERGQHCGEKGNFGLCGDALGAVANYNDHVNRAHWEIGD